jgi:hypothetical protein
MISTSDLRLFFFSAFWFTAWAFGARFTGTGLEGPVGYSVVFVFGRYSLPDLSFEECAAGGVKAMRCLDRRWDPFCI